MTKMSDNYALINYIFDKDVRRHIVSSSRSIHMFSIVTESLGEFPSGFLIPAAV